HPAKGAARTSVPVPAVSVRPGEMSASAADQGNTPMALSTSFDEPEKKSRGGLVVGALAVLALWVGGYFYVNSSSSPNATSGAAGARRPSVGGRSVPLTALRAASPPAARAARPPPAAAPARAPSARGAARPGPPAAAPPPRVARATTGSALRSRAASFAGTSY